MTPSGTLTGADAAPESQIARDMARRSLPAVPAVLLVCGLVWGAAGVASGGYALVLVLANFLLAATLLTWAARVSLGAVMAVALGGYVLRLALVGFAVWAVRDAGWVEPLALGLTLVGTHLGLLLWELRYVSASLAFPGLRPVTASAPPRNRPAPVHIPKEPPT